MCISCIGQIICSEIHKRFNCVGSKEELFQQWKDLTVVPVYMKNGRQIMVVMEVGLSLLTPTYKILSNILLSRLTPYVDRIIGDHQCGFRRDRSTVDHVHCIR